MCRKGSGIAGFESDRFAGNVEAVSFETDPEIERAEDLSSVAKVKDEAFHTRLHLFLQTKSDSLLAPLEVSGHTMRMDAQAILNRR